MLNVSDAFLTAWRSPSKFAVHRIKYKRRYWTGSAFVYEATWKVITMKKIVEVGNVNITLDTVEAGVFRTSNIILSLPNNKYEWSPYNQAGIFGPDAVAPNGYQPYRTLFQIEFGYEVSDGTEEVLQQFTGYLVDFRMHPARGTFEATISGKEADLEENDAQKVSTAFTNEAVIPSIGDGVVKDFYTSSLGIGYITQVRIGGSIKKEGIDYTISRTNQYGAPAMISFVDPPNVIEGNIDASGIAWLADKKVEELAAAICDYCGVTDRVIDTAFFPNGVNGNKEITTQAEWQAGSLLQNVSATVDPDNLRLKWFARGTAFYEPELPIKTHRALITFPGGPLGFAVYSVRKNDLWSPTSHYGLVFSSAAGNVRLCITDGTGNVSSVLGTVLPSLPSGAHEYIIQADMAAGQFKVWYDGMLKLEVSNTAFTGYFNSGILVWAGSETTAAGIYVSSDLCGADAFDGDQVATYESAEFDLLGAPTAWGKLDTSILLNGGTVSCRTSVRDPGGVWDEWVSVDSGMNILSNLKQKLKIQISISHANNSLVSPVVRSVQANFTSSTIFVALANFSGKDCYQALQLLAGIFNGELGFTGAGVFFFRGKSTSSTPLTLDQKQVIEISNLAPGWKEVRNNSQVSYLPYYKEYNSNTLPETAPTSKDIYGDRIRIRLMSSFLLANDADIATGMAQIGHDDNYRPKRHVRVAFKLIPFLEVSDVIALSFFEDPLKKDNVFGDPLQKFAPAFGEDSAVLLRNAQFKVVGITHNYNNFRTETQLEEIL